ncbi:hypothetical protein [Pelagicoccus mobilis]|uniref:Uncharacterized protein n=1 Tax=Pelagicoccus mobilis TaxID=415221 RepID=A0A934VS06_9BACT|nr:hypothetical protein [Pelagicoccus mobilis]MBK1879952.1 hypothetical protein [Pelagicoccus mobilis]
MPNASHTATANADQRLSQLIRLKRLETPDGEFWQSFEQEYRVRQMSSLVQVQPLHTRIRKACVIFARKAAPPVAAVSAVAITVVAVRNSPDLPAGQSEDQSKATSQFTQAEVDSSAEEAYFVVQQEKEQLQQPLEIEADGTIYQMNVLSHGYATGDAYLLNATPVTFIHSQAQQNAEAKIISEQPDY